MTARLLLAALGLGLLAVASGSAAGSAPLEARAVTLGSPGLPALRAPAAASATWCGATTTRDVAPNVVAGFPVHWVYAMPSDGPDRLTTYANVMQTDAEAIDAWWRREDSTKAPRNDLRRLSCGTQLDISSVRLQLTGDELDSDFSFGDILDGLEDAGFDSNYTKYVVYYDGPTTPTPEGEVCGRGGSVGSDGTGLGLAVVYVRACVGVSTAAVAAHELLHTLDAVPFGAPYECDGHVCDTDTDIMYPELDDDPLEAKLLDVGRDDYYGHTAVRNDVQDADWLIRLDTQVSVRLTLAGKGSVAANVPGLLCTATCTTTWNLGTELLLTATPARGQKFVRWTGACSGSTARIPRCVASSAPERRIGAVFAPRTYPLTVSVAGKGVVRSSARGIACRARCSASFSSHVPLRLTATPAKGWKLRSWAGACRGKRATCTVAMSKATTARAAFVRAPSR